MKGGFILILITNYIDNLNIKSFRIERFNDSLVEEAKEIFKNHKEKNIIYGEFDDDSWKLLNEVEEKNINFNFNQIKFKSQNKKRNLGEFNDFILACKTYIVFMLNELSIANIQLIITTLKTFMNNTDYLSEEKLEFIFEDKKLYKYPIIVNFLDFYKIEISDLVFDILEKKSNAFNQKLCSNKAQRNLCNMESIFKFYEYIDLFWLNATKDEKEEFFPIKLWWEISMIIPIRVTELLLTPLDCIKEKNNKYYISLRRTSLKGKKIKKINHKIELDYYIQDVPITKEIVNLIEEYKSIVKYYDYIKNFYFDECKYNNNVSERKTLFSKRSYVRCLKNIKQYRNKFFHDNTIEMLSYDNMSILLERFQKNILGEKYNLKVIQKETKNKLEYDEIEHISLLDTRHYAFMNLALNNVDPLVMMSYGGHNNVSSGYHYYQHLAKFVEFYTYYMAKKIVMTKQASNDKEKIKFELEKDNNIDNFFYKIFSTNKKKVKVKNGFCCSEQTEFQDCMLVDNDCYSCNFFRKDKESIKNIINEEIENNFKEIKLEVEELKYLIKNFEHEFNARERIGLNINKIKSHSNKNTLLLINNRGDELYE